MNNFNENHSLSFQNNLIEKVCRLIPNLEKPVRLEKDLTKDFYYRISDILAGAGLLKRHFGQNYVFNGIVYELLDIDGLKHFIYNTVYQGGIILSEKECRMIIKEILIRTPEYMGIPND